jgi:hypothetical protein
LATEGPEVTDVFPPGKTSVGLKEIHGNPGGAIFLQLFILWVLCALCGKSILIFEIIHGR